MSEVYDSIFTICNAEVNFIKALDRSGNNLYIKANQMADKWQKGEQLK